MPLFFINWGSFVCLKGKTGVQIPICKLYPIFSLAANSQHKCSNVPFKSPLKNKEMTFCHLLIEGGVFWAKFELFLKPTLTRNESPRHRLAEPRQPRKKNTPCISDLAGGNFF